MKHFLPLLFAAMAAVAAYHLLPLRTPAVEGDPVAAAREAPRAEDEQGSVVQLNWEDLIPADFNPNELFAEYDLETLDDDDPRAREILERMQEEWRHAPVVESLHGRRVKLPGFVIPLEGDGRQVSEFLLVPYFGACIHVPPPPSNQIVYVKAGREGTAVRNMYDTVWVTGTLITERRNNPLGDAGYTLEAERIEPYEE